MKLFNYLLGFILLFILLIAPISTIYAQELWSYDPNKNVKFEITDSYYGISEVCISENANYIAVGLYRENFIRDEKGNNILDEQGRALKDRQSKIVSLNTKGEELWSFKTQYRIETIRMDKKGEFIAVETNSFPCFTDYNKCGEKVYVFNKSGTPLWTYEDARFPYVDSSGNVLLHTPQGVEMYTVDKKMLWRYPQKDLSCLGASDDLELIVVGVSAYDEQKMETIYSKIQLLDKKGRIVWQRNTKDPIRNVYFSNDGNLILANTYGSSGFYLFDKNGNSKTYLPENIFINNLSMTPDGKYIITTSTNKYMAGAKSTDELILLNHNAEVLWKVNIDSENPYDIKISNDGNYIYILYCARSLVIMDARTGEELKSINNRNFCSLYSSKDGKYLTTGAYKLLLLDTQSLNKYSSSKNVGPSPILYMSLLSLAGILLYYLRNKSR